MIPLLFFQTQQQTTQQPPLIAPGSEGSYLLLASTLITLLCTNFFQIWRESRNRKWDLEDRKAQRDLARVRAELLHNSTIETAFQVAKVSTRNKDHLVNEISKNTEITKDVGAKAQAAYEAANNFNEKLEALRTDFLKRTKHIEVVGDDTNEKVTEMQDGQQTEQEKT